MSALVNVPIEDWLFAGAVSLERGDKWVKPWRIPFTHADLFPPQALRDMAEIPAGVRLRFNSNTTVVALDLVATDCSRQCDCVVNGEHVASATAAPGETTVMFTTLPANEKVIEIYLSQKVTVQIAGLRIETNASLSRPDSQQLRWVTYGSSITQCAAATSPALTWPAIVARKHNLNLTCLGYGANCHAEPMVARMIRDLPADLLSVCIGVNIMGGSSLSLRTFRPAVIGLLSIIREKHADKPLAVMSPIIAPKRESNPNAVGLTLAKMRDEIEIAVRLLQAHGDSAIFYVNGLELFNETYLEHMPDQLHPDAEGYRILAANFDQIVMSKLLATRA